VGRCKVLKIALYLQGPRLQRRQPFLQSDASCLHFLTFVMYLYKPRVRFTLSTCHLAVDRFSQPPLPWLLNAEPLNPSGLASCQIRIEAPYSGLFDLGTLTNVPHKLSFSPEWSDYLPCSLKLLDSSIFDRLMESRLYPSRVASAFVCIRISGSPPDISGNRKFQAPAHFPSLLAWEITSPFPRNMDQIMPFWTRGSKQGM